MNHEHDIGSLGTETIKCKISTNIPSRAQNYTFVNGRPGFNKNFILKSFCRDQTKQNYEYAFAKGPKITYAPSNDEFLKSGMEEISEV